jgi:hypothetical protein
MDVGPVPSAYFNIRFGQRRRVIDSVVRDGDLAPLCLEACDHKMKYMPSANG